MAESTRPITAVETLRADLIDILLGPASECRMTDDEAQSLADRIMRLPVIAQLFAGEIRVRRK